MKILISLICGIIFGLGLLISGMTNPAKVQNFFDILGHWDASLAFVILGALMVTIPGYWLVLKRPKPLLAVKFNLPSKTDVDAPLVYGSLMFGIGWGIAGFCPGPAISMLGSGHNEPIYFVLSMLIGMTAVRWFRYRTERAN